MVIHGMFKMPNKSYEGIEFDAWERKKIKIYLIFIIIRISINYFKIYLLNEINIRI